MNKYMKKVRYEVRGAVLQRAKEIEQDLANVCRQHFSRKMFITSEDVFSSSLNLLADWEN